MSGMVGSRASSRSRSSSTVGSTVSAASGVRCTGRLIEAQRPFTGGQHRVENVEVACDLGVELFEPLFEGGGHAGARQGVAAAVGHASGPIR